VTLDGAALLSWSDGTGEVNEAEIFVREWSSCEAFTLRSKSNGAFVVIDGNDLSATGPTSGTAFGTETCGDDPLEFVALRADTNGDGDAFNDSGNFWKSNDNVDLTYHCPANDATSWEKFQIAVVPGHSVVSCGAPALVINRLLRGGQI
jgi:hypothetical protein